MTEIKDCETTQEPYTYKVDSGRRLEPMAGIFVRARDGNEWVSADIATLRKDDLLHWLQSRGGSNSFAEDVVGILLGYGNLHTNENMER